MLASLLYNAIEERDYYRALYKELTKELSDWWDDLSGMTDEEAKCYNPYLEETNHDSKEQKQSQ